MTDAEIEAAAKKAGGRWNGDVWVFEDADLHPFVRAVQAAEQARLKADAEAWGSALNAAGWEATEAYRRHTGQVDPTIFFNHAKGIVRDALAAYFKALGA